MISHFSDQMKYPQHGSQVGRRRFRGWVPIVLGIMAFGFLLSLFVARESRSRDVARRRGHEVMMTQAIVSRSTAKELNGRYDAARQISNMQTSNKALAKLAGDAGRAGDDRIVVMCIKMISDLEIRQKAAVEAAGALADMNNVQGAVNLLKLTPNLLAKNARPLLKKVTQKGDSRAAQTLIKLLPVNERNAAAYQAALLMVKHGHSSSAVRVAQQISDSTVRDRAMNAIATNDTSELNREETETVEPSEESVESESGSATESSAEDTTIKFISQ